MRWPAGVVLLLILASMGLSLPTLEQAQERPASFMCSEQLFSTKTFIANTTLTYTGLACRPTAQVFLYECNGDCSEKTFAAKGYKLNGTLVTFDNYTIDTRYYYECFSCADPLKNKAPLVVVNSKTITVSEGEKVEIVAACNDLEGDLSELTFAGWMDSPARETSYSDAGQYVVRVTCRDEFGAQAEEQVQVRVTNVNRAPIIEAVRSD